MIGSFDGLAVRQLRTRRLRAALTALGIVLGVGMVFGVLVLVGTIRHTFSDLIDSAWGKTDVVISGVGDGRLSSQTLQRVRDTSGVEKAGAMIGSVFTRLDGRGDAISGAKGRMMVAGYDPNEPAPYDFRFVEGRPLRSGPEIVVERNWARDRGVAVGDSIRVGAPAGRVRLRVVGVFRFSNGLSFGGMGLAAMPLPAARRLMRIPEGFQQISVVAADKQSVEGLQRRLRRQLGGGVEVKTPRAVGQDIEKQLRGLNVVLYFFSGIALFVGGFLILNAFNMTVLQRMRELGMLRTLGATRGMVLRTVLVEALALGVLGSLLGLALGLGLAVGLVAMMNGLGMPVGSLVVAPGAAVTALLLGLVTTALGAYWPARRASRVAPIRAVLGTATARRRVSVNRALVGAALFLPGALFGGRFWFTGDQAASPIGAVLGIAGTMAMFAGMALAAPFVIGPLVRLLAWPLRRLSPTGGRLASDATRSNPARTAATAAALTIGLSVVVVNSSMAGSFLGTIRDQIDAGYASDFTVRPQGQPLDAPGQTVPPAVRPRIAAIPGVAVVTPQRTLLLKLPGRRSSQPGLVEGVDPRAFGEVDHSPITGASRATALRSLAQGGVIVGRPYAKAAGLEVGDTLVLRGPRGVRRARVAGVLGTIGDFSGNVMQVSLPTMRRVYGNVDDAQLLVKLRRGADRDAVDRKIRRLVQRDFPQVEALSVAEVKADLEAEINRNFAMFNAIIGIAIIVSLLGVINTLAMSVVERTREIGVLRALGSSRWLVRLTMLDESLLITLAGALAGVGLGSLIGYMWIRGLDALLPGIGFRFPTGTVVLVVGLAVVLGVLAAILPARRAARLDVIQALNYE